MDRRSFLKRGLKVALLAPVAAVAPMVLAKEKTLTPLNPEGAGNFCVDSFGLFDGETLIRKRHIDSRRYVMDGDVLKAHWTTEFQF